MRVASVVIFFLTFLLCVSSSYSQTYKFKLYSVDQGLPQAFVYTINQDNNGYIWVGTGEGLCRFDGNEFETYTTQDGLADNFVCSSYKDKHGRLWFGHNNGGVSLYDGLNFKILGTDTTVISRINSIIEDKHGNIWFASQNHGLIKVNDRYEYEIFIDEFKDILIYSINFTESNNLLLGTNEGIYVYDVDSKGGKPELVTMLDDAPLTLIHCIIKNEEGNTFWIGTEDEGIHSLKIKSEEPFEAATIKLNFPGVAVDANIQHVLKDKGNNLLMCTSQNGLIKAVYSQSKQRYTEIVNYDEKNGLGNNYVKSAFLDIEGNIWIATYGNGLALLQDDFFTFFQLNDIKENNQIYSIVSDNDRTFFGTANGLLMKNSENPDSLIIIGKDHGLPEDIITALFMDMNKVLWIGTDKNGIFQMDPESVMISKFALSDDRLVNSINAIDNYGEIVWIATKNGLFLIDTKTGERKKYSTNTGLPHNSINHIYVDLQGDTWVATPGNDLCVIKGGEIIKYKISEENLMLNITCITQDNDGNIWFGTYGNGVYQYNMKEFRNITSRDGLKSDYCYSISHDDGWNIWVGHRLGISKITKDYVRTFGKEVGILGDCYPNSVYREYSGIIWFGTSEGAIKYNPQKDKINKVPPRINITSVKFSDISADFKQVIGYDNEKGNTTYDFYKKIEMPYDAYKLRIDFVGLSYKAPDKVLYQYKLEGYDLEWSEPGSNPYVIYNRIEDGEYTFLLNAWNEDGICGDSAIKIHLSVGKPIWKQWWFLTICIIGLVYAIYLFIRYRERRHRNFQIHLKKILDERTREVVLQKEEIERNSKNITDSINYARRIQYAILPPMKQMQDVFPESFVFYRPRDIVSGDFFWFDMVTKTKFLAICADATGHGVPGAFMSLIGTTMIKDFCKRGDVTSPADILINLDESLDATMNAHKSEEQTSDGMDIAVIEIDIESLYMKFSAAMSSFFLLRNNELRLIRGNRFPIGGRHAKQKIFENIIFQLERGDIIYMFTDGYQDQFGGPRGKKITSKGVREIIMQMHEQPMKEQRKFIEQNFNEWIDHVDSDGDKFNQIDDVLFMGIKI